MTRCAIIGFGEVGERFALDLAKGGAHAITAFDIAPGARGRAAGCAGVDVAETAAAAAASADVVFLAVTAGSALEAATGLVGGLAHGPFVLDVNSVSPATKRLVADEVEAAGGRYVEAAIMSSIASKGLRSPVLLGGPHTEAFVDIMAPFETDLTPFSASIGAASSVKMCRSVIIKGLEAIATESMLTARRFGVEGHVLASLADTLPHGDWPGLVRYLIGRALMHGERRSEEMLEAAETVRQAGLEPILSAAIARRQAWAAEVGVALGHQAIASYELGPLLDAISGLPTAGRARADPDRRRRRMPAAAGAMPPRGNLKTSKERPREP